MKRKDFFIGIIAASVITAGLTAYGVSKLPANKTSGHKTIEVISEGAGTHFTSYDRDNYPDLTYAAENAVQAVVNIEKIEEVQVRGRSRDPFLEFFGIPQDSRDGEGYSRERRSGGSGVIISSDGYIVTNDHVIENASKLKITLYDNRTYEGRIIGTDPTTDVALIKIEEEDLPTLPFGDSDALRLGEWVLAIGSPFDLRSTITAGIVSAKARSLTKVPLSYNIESFIQTDAAVNPGNSGGALINAKGELVGINTVIKSPTGSFTGYSFAVPVSIVKKVVVDLKEYGVVQRAILGISFQEIDNEFIERFGDEYGISEIGGIYVAEVDPDGGAAAAGIKKGDIVTEINGIKIDNSAVLLENVGKHRPNDKVTLTIKRDGKVKQIEVVLRNKAGKAELLERGHTDAAESLGGTFSQIDDKTKKKFDIEGGLVVTKVKEGGVLSQMDIQRGFIITHINNRAVKSVNDLAKITGKITSVEGIDPKGYRIKHHIKE